MAYLRILCGILPFVFFFSLFAFYLLVEDMGWLARLLCILCVLGTLGVCLAFQVWFYRIVQSRRREEQRLALAQECVRQQSLRPRGANYLSGKYGYLGTGIGLSSVQEVGRTWRFFRFLPPACYAYGAFRLTLFPALLYSYFFSREIPSILRPCMA